ncbi:D-3-phosphoglycerate dehydrogenase isoform X2 [Bacillus rossius redtenbacheri]|uniref:D-3-phosphoglycerate dehydrogenase isoform X2 n=1 Tax=Bacillus rossius redtenbacheri TaxID=93214 RepID=UPI002FDCDFB4
MSVLLRKVLISDPVDDACVRLLQEHGIEATCKYRLSKDDLVKEIKNYEGLIVRSETKVTADVIASASSLKVIGRAGTGVDNIDINAATKKGVIVLNAPGGNSISACELTCALIANLARNVTEACMSLKDGRWDRKLFAGFELSGKTLAVLGLGRIGREVAARMQSYGMRVIGFDPLVSASDAKAFNVEKMELEEIWPLADFITVHTPLIPQTRNLINETVLSKCKSGVRVVNVARGGIVDEAALLAALKSGRCGGAGLDVFAEEPPQGEVTRELIRHPKVVATPHLGASTAEAQRRVAVEVAEQFVALAAGCSSEYRVTGAVNAPVLAAAASPASDAWIRLAKELGRILSKLVKGVIPDTLIEIRTSGEALGGMKFLGTAVLMGMLTGHTKNGLNMINAPTLAKEAGIEVVAKHDSEHDAAPLLQVSVSLGKVGSHSVQGTV